MGQTHLYAINLFVSFTSILKMIQEAFQSFSSSPIIPSTVL